MINFSIRGNSKGIALLLIHPMGAEKSFWDSCCDIWDEKFLTIACDLRGAGRSTWRGELLTFDNHVKDLSLVAQSLELKNFVPIGCAVGSMIAAQFAATYPDQIRSLILSNPGIKTAESAQSVLAQRAKDVRQGGIDAILPGAVDAAFDGCPDDDTRAHYVAKFRKHDPLSYAATVEGIIDADISKYFRKIDVPTLLVAGGRDKLLPVDHATRIRRIMLAAEYQLIEEGAHFIPYQRPKQFANLVTKFIGD